MIGYVFSMQVVWILTAVVLAKTARYILRDYRESTSTPIGFVIWLLSCLVMAPLLTLVQAVVLFPYAVLWGISFMTVGFLASFLGSLGMLVLGIYGVVSAVVVLKWYWDDALDSGGAFASASRSCNPDSFMASSSCSYNSDPHTTAQNNVIVSSQMESPSYGYESGGNNSGASHGGFGLIYGPSPGHPGGDQATTNYN